MRHMPAVPTLKRVKCLLPISKNDPMDRYTHKNETRAPSYTTHENELKWIKDLNARPETMKILEQSTGSKILHMAHSNILLNVSPQARETKEK